MMKRIVRFLLLAPLLVACKGGVFSEQSVPEAEQRTIVETGELSAVRTKAFVLKSSRK